MKIVLIVGTRPEAIKVAPVYFALKDCSWCDPVIVSTGQHREMLDQALEVFGLAPDLDLNLMMESVSLSDLTGKIISGVSKVLDDVRPAAVLVQGDTSSVLGGALAAFFNQVPIGHIEAGLRTADPLVPFPEETNRRLVGRLARWHFSPTQNASSNLLDEGVDRDRVFVTGNTVIDSLKWVQKNRLSAERIDDDFLLSLGVSRSKIKFFQKKWILMTGHRRESFGDGFRSTCRAVAKIAELNSDVGILFPVHLNPQVRAPVNEILGSLDQVCLVEPVSYVPFIRLMASCHFIISDSGGVQEEAPSLGKPVLVTRDSTERPEGVEAGVCRLVGTEEDVIVAESLKLLNDDFEYQQRASISNPFGEGDSSQKIESILRSYLLK